MLLLIFFAEGALLYREFYIRSKFKRLAEKKYKQIEELLRMLNADEPIDSKDLLRLAQDPSLRCGLFKMLSAYNKHDLFPNEYLTIEKGAEGHLVNWLEFPTELGKAPDEIEVIKKVTLKGEAIDYYTFKYKSQSPRWVKQLDWIIGVSGPYHENSKPYDIPVRVFSRFNTIASSSPEKEVEWVHNNINT